MLNLLLISLGKFITLFSQSFNFGNGSTWPGHIALEINKNFIKQVIKKNQKLKVVLVAGTNGKTTTGKLIRFLLEKNGLKVFQNESGANLLNGIASTLIANSNIFGKLNYDAAIFEIDENTLSQVVKDVTPTAIILLNLFRDQLDRYGEVNTIAVKWQTALKTVPKITQLFSNGDDPMLTYISQESHLPTIFFGLDQQLMAKKDIPHDVDFLFCPKCGEKLIFSKMSYSHMGLFSCPKKHFSHPETSYIDGIEYPLFGVYNIYNTNAAALTVKTVFGIDERAIKGSLKNFKPAFGRQEVIKYKNRNVILLLSKNPTGFNQSIDAINSLKASYIALVILNDRIPDGRDVSWIWDVDFEKLSKASKIILSGDRTYDMALRFQYSLSIPDFGSKVIVENKLESALDQAVKQTPECETLFILPTYSAMLEVREILHGRKIL